MSCPRTRHLNNVPRLRGEKHYISLKILHQAGLETARQAATSAERQALTIAACPSQQARDIQSMLGQRWASIADGGPALNRHRLNVSCLLAMC